MSSCGGGTVWPRLLLPPPPPGMGREDAGTQDWGPGCSFTPEVVVAAHRTVRPSGCEPWLLKDLCHPELDSGGGESRGEGGATPSGGGKLEVPSQRPHSLLQDGLLLLPQSAEAAAVPVGECGRRSLPLFRSAFRLLTVTVGGGAWVVDSLGGRAG